MKTNSTEKFTDHATAESLNRTPHHSSETSQEAQQDKGLFQLIEPLVSSQGYELIHLETLIGKQNLLRIFIDHSNGITVEDCTKVSRALDEPLENSTLISYLFKSTYELEVSSPGIDRPISRRQDFERFKGEEIRIQLYRPLTSDEAENTEYTSKNPKQKNYLGTLVGLENDKISIEVNPLDGTDQTMKLKKGTKPKAKQRPLVKIPLIILHKVNLSPERKI